jgi:hypothetical protein
MENQADNQNESVEQPLENEKVETDVESAKDVEKQPEPNVKTFTQEEVNKIIQERVNKEKVKAERAKMSENERIQAEKADIENQFNEASKKLVEYENTINSQQVANSLLSIGLDTNQIENIKMIAGGNLTHLKDKPIDELSTMFSSMITPQQVKSVVGKKPDPQKEKEKENQRVPFWERARKQY